MPSVSWRLDRYARFCYSDSKKDGEWKQYDDSSSPLVMSITDTHQLIIAQDSTIMESHSLASAHLWMRGVSRNDSLLFMYKFKNETRRFRVRFMECDSKNGKEVCGAASQQLSQYFPVKMSCTGTGGSSNTNTQQDTRNTSKDTASAMKESTAHVTADMKYTDLDTLTGEVTLGAMASAVMEKKSLPQAYQHHHIDADMIPQLLRLCLSDPTFPAFVESVESALQDVMNDSK